MTPIEPIEAVARAIQRVAEQDGGPSYLQLQREFPVSFERLHDQARAAITALRDCGVTEGMADAAYGTAKVHSTVYLSVRRDLATEFRAMLDAVLTEST